MSELEDMRAELEALKLQLAQSKEREEQVRRQLQDVSSGSDAHAAAAQEPSTSNQEAVSSSHVLSSQGSQQNQVPIYVSSRRMERFSDRPTSLSGVSVLDWIADMKSYLASHPMPVSQQTAVVMGHLAGRARQEIQGRGSSVKDPATVFSILLSVFGDGDTLGQLRTKFYGYQQSTSENLLSCSLELLSLYSRMEDHDPELSQDRDRVLKERLADAVLDSSLSRELRRLNMESPSLSFFDMRDRAIRWIGSDQQTTQPDKSAVKKNAVIQEAPTVIDPVLKLLQEHQFLLQNLMGEVKDLKKSRHESRSTGHTREGTMKRKCYVCSSTNHLMRDCPVKKFLASSNKTGTEDSKNHAENGNGLQQ